MAMCTVTYDRQFGGFLRGPYMPNKNILFTIDYYTPRNPGQRCLGFVFHLYIYIGIKK
jgi:hypothetical protein